MSGRHRGVFFLVASCSACMGADAWTARGCAAPHAGDALLSEALRDVHMDVLGAGAQLWLPQLVLPEAAAAKRRADDSQGCDGAQEKGAPAPDRCSPASKRSRADGAAPPRDGDAPGKYPTVAPCAVPSDASALRAWLLERRAALQRARDGILQNRASLQKERTCWAHVQTVVASQRQRRQPRAASAGDALGAGVPNVSELLDEDILCL